ncbi:hypothetical protein V5799_025631 [Amblyomma americanum]|uniref:Uncharacterized protein n=1 Tax=Amblyomma americanum TaxID=6943 RepID=A0AAQ4E8W4_AMBAM
MGKSNSSICGTVGANVAIPEQLYFKHNCDLGGYLLFVLGSVHSVACSVGAPIHIWTIMLGPLSAVSALFVVYLYSSETMHLLMRTWAQWC